MDAGAIQETTDRLLAFEVADTDVGAPAMVAGVAGPDGAEAAPVPAALVALTVNVYGEPLVRPVTVQLVVADEQTAPPGDVVTV